MSLKKETLEGVTFEGKPVTIFIEEEEHKEIDKHIRSEIRDVSAGISHYSPAKKSQANTSGTRSQREDRIRKIESPEVIAHLNYLHQKGGRTMVTAALNQPQIMNGSIESALEDAQEKVNFYNKEVKRNQLEYEKWVSVKNQLSSALDTVKGKTTASDSNTQTRGKKGKWLEIAKTLLGNGVTSMKATDFRQKMLESGGGTNIKPIYMAFSYLKKRNVIEEINGYISLCK